MNVLYRRVNSRQWEPAIALGWYGELGYFILRWQDDIQDYDEVLVPASRIRVPA